MHESNTKQNQNQLSVMLPNLSNKYSIFAILAFVSAAGTVSKSQATFGVHFVSLGNRTLKTANRVQLQTILSSHALFGCN